MKSQPKKAEKKPRKNAAVQKPGSSLTFKNLSLDSVNESYTPDEGASQLSNNNDVFSSLSLAALENNPLYKFNREYMSLKHKIVRTFGFCFYNIEEYGLLNYICHVSEKKFKSEIGSLMVTTDIYQDNEHRVEKDIEAKLYLKKDELNAKFLDAQKSMIALKESKMLMDKDDDAGCIKINHKFFNMVPSICEDLLKKTNEQEKQLGGEQQVHCKACGRKREIYQIQAKNRCECGSNEATTKDQKVTNTILVGTKTLVEQVNKVKKWHAQMIELHNREVNRIKQLRSKGSDGNRVTDADKDVAKAIEFIERERANTPGYVSPWDKYPIKRNGVFLRMAEKDYEPKRTYAKVRQLQQLAETRKRRKLEKIDMPDIL